MPVYAISVKSTFQGPGSPGFNIWHVRTQNITFDDDLNDAITEIAAFYERLKVQFPSGTSFRVGEQVTRVDVSPPETQAYTVTTVTATGGSAQLPERLAVLIKLGTAKPGRSGRGRKFMGPLKQGVVELDGTVDETVRTAFQTSINTLIAASSGPNQWAIGVWSPMQQELYDLVAASVDNELAQLSSRRF